ncbi:MAG: type II toxin-antitoxin system HicA family toxin [Snowella sp.]|nr:type II toxin-antitoxin system HicA family toxin [Snowella sp.]
MGLSKSRSPDMSKIPVLKPQEVIRILEKLGFVEVRQRGSHKQFRHEDGRGTTVPCHKGRDISPTLLRTIASDINLTLEEFLKGR